MLRRKQKLSNFSHIMRAENESLERLTMLGGIEGTKVRPSLCLIDGVKVAAELSLVELRKAE